MSATMDLVDLKLWHWSALGTLAGILLACATMLDPPPRDPLVRRPSTAEQFITRLKEKRGGQPVVRNIIVHPPHDGQNYVTFEALAPDVFKPFGFHADIPFEAAAISAPSIVQALDEARLRDPQISYAYPWPGIE